MIDMGIQQRRRTRLLLTGLILLAELLHLGWEYWHGGVKSHHLLNRPDLPAISNGWGLLLLPLLTWFLLGRIQDRVVTRSVGVDNERKLPVDVIAGFVGSLCYGAVLALAFMQGREDLSSYLFLGMLLAALLLPVYRPEYILGFILGLTFTFGAILPTIVTSLVAAVSAALHFLRRQLIRLIAILRLRVGRAAH